jgi:hypothetical protein
MSFHVSAGPTRQDNEEVGDEILPLGLPLLRPLRLDGTPPLCLGRLDKLGENRFFS